MTGNMAVMADGSKRRLISGWLDHVIDSRIATRWAVLEKSADCDSVTLHLFRSDKEACEKQAYKLGKENFIGTERGSVKQYNKKTSVLYWAIITVHNQTLLFQDSHNSNKSVSTFEKWDKILKDFWNHQSWLVVPQEGPNSFVKERGLTLHLNRASVCFAYLNPPRHYCRLYLDTIEQVSYEGTTLCFNVAKDNNSGGYYEVKTDRERFAAKIKEVIECLRSRYLGITSPDPIKCCAADNQKIAMESPSCVSHFLEKLTLVGTSPNPVPHQDKPSPVSPIDETTGEDIHMDINSLFRNCNRINSNCPQKSPPISCACTPPQCKLPESDAFCIPSIKIVPVTVVAEQCQLESECCLKQVPVIPPRTTSCSNGMVQAATTDVRRNDNRISTANLQKSASTGKLHVLTSDQVWEPPPGLDKEPPVPTPRRKVPEGSDSSRITSAVQLPLPKPPVSTSPTSNERPCLVRHVGQDEFDSMGDSMSSIASQSSDVASMETTRSLSSLSSEEERCRSSSTESRRKSPIRTSALSLNSCPNPPIKVPGYNRSFSVPTELPRHHPFPEIAPADPDYQPTEQEYINVSKESLTTPKVTDELDPLYMNMSHEQSPYVNPPLKPSVNPIPVPPRHPQPPPSSRTSRPEGSAGCLAKSCESMELHVLLNAMLKGEEQGSTMGLPMTVWLKFCLNCDMERSNYSPNNWKGLAEQLGLSSSDIVLVDDYSRRYNKKPTEVILSYWERQAEPQRPFCKDELVSMLHELDRQDLLDIIIQREKYTGACAR